MLIDIINNNESQKSMVLFGTDFVKRTKSNQPAGSIIVLKTENCDRWKDESVLVRDSYMG